MQSVLETRPIYHKHDETISGAGVLLVSGARAAQELGERLAAPVWKLAWDDVV